MVNRSVSNKFFNEPLLGPQGVYPLRLGCCQVLWALSAPVLVRDVDSFVGTDAHWMCWVFHCSWPPVASVCGGHGLGLFPLGCLTGSSFLKRLVFSRRPCAAASASPIGRGRCRMFGRIPVVLPGR